MRFMWRNCLLLRTEFEALNQSDNPAVLYSVDLPFLSTNDYRFKFTTPLIPFSRYLTLYRISVQKQTGNGMGKS